MSTTTTTFADLREHQAHHLAQWKTVLLPEVYAELEDWVRLRTNKVVKDDALVDWAKGESDLIPRGTTIDEIVHTIAACRYHKGKNKS